MPIKNPTSILLQAVKYPLAIEAKLPVGAPKLSEMMTDVATKLPEVPDLPMEIPDLPEAPALPEMPELPGGLAKGVRGVTITPVETVRREVIPSPAVGVIPEVRTRRGM
ncbi:unnamed protein product [marine sediment metagenome]|uniref:Uncharacterized protein n=1 Tax=marine sediment metagenome TaxID=412755 RepID=X1M5C3_9ZZZZ